MPLLKIKGQTLARLHRSFIERAITIHPLIRIMYKHIKSILFEWYPNKAATNHIEVDL